MRATVVVPSKSGGEDHRIVISGANLTVEHGSCRGFEYRKTCSHLQVTEEECGWHGGRSAVPQSQPGKCPLCGSMTVDAMYGVKK